MEKKKLIGNVIKKHVICLFPLEFKKYSVRHGIEEIPDNRLTCIHVPIGTFAFRIEKGKFVESAFVLN